MSTYTKYPNQVDTSTELPKATDLVTPVNGEAVNRLREAILAIENELGAQPSGTFSTVRARLDAMDTALLSLGADVDSIDPTIEILQDSSSINANANAINFTGNVEVTNDGAGVSVEIIGGQATQIQEAFVATNGQTSFTLSDTPFQVNGVQMFVNGVKMRYGADYSVSGTTVTYIDDVVLVSGDEVEFWYLVESAGLVGASSLLVQDEGVTVDSSVSIIDFTGDVTVTNPAAGKVSVAISTSIPNPWETTNQVINDSGTFEIQAATLIDLQIDAISKLNISSSVITPTIPITFSSSATATLNQATPTTDTSPLDLTIAAQSPYASATGTNRIPGDLVLEVGTPTNSGTTYGKISAKLAGSERLALNYNGTTTSFDIPAGGNFLTALTQHTGDTSNAPAIGFKAAQASSTASTTDRQRGGAFWIRAGEGTTTGTHEPGPIYVGLGTAIGGSVANGILMGYGAETGTPGTSDYIPYTTSLARHTVIGDTYEIRGLRPMTLRTVTIGHQLSLISADAVNVTGATNINLTATAGTITTFSAASFTQIASFSALNLFPGDRVLHIGHYADGIDRFKPRFPADVATAAVTKVALATIAIATGRPSTFRGSVAGWPASGAGQYVDIFFNAENIAGTVSIIGSSLTTSGAALGTVTVEVSSTNVVVYVEPGSATAYTWRTTLLEER